MPKRHLKRIVAPNTWVVERKVSRWITRPNPGAHSLDACMSLETVMKEIIKCARTRKEVMLILNKKQMLVDGKRRKNVKLPVGIMDVVSIPETSQHFRMLLNKNGMIYALEIKKEEANIKLCKITGKSIVKGGITQLNLSDSRNILMKKGEKFEYNVGDSLLISLPDQVMKQHIKLENGAAVYLTGGKYVGCVGHLENMQGDVIKVKLDSGDVAETSKKYAFAVGKEKPLLSLKE